MDNRSMSGTSWHVTYGDRKKSYDPRRSKSRCVYYNKGMCEFSYQHCNSSVHCKAYTEIQKQKKYADPDAHLEAKQLCEKIKINAELSKRKKEEKLKQRQALREKKAKCSLIIKSEHLDEYEKLISNVRGYLYDLVWHCTQSKLKGVLPRGKTRIGIIEAIVEDIYNLTKVRVKIETRAFDLLFYESMVIVDNYTLEIDVDKLIELVKNGFVEKVNKEIVEKETFPVFTRKKLF